MNTTTKHTPECLKATGKQTQFDLTCKRCNLDSYESVVALRPEAEKFYAKQGHTPGPWKYEDGFSMFSANGHLLNMDQRTNVGKANAQLIAASPELLAALKGEHRGYETKHGFNYEGANPNACKVCLLIAKAEGRA